MSVRFLGVVWHTPLLALALCVAFPLAAAPYLVVSVLWGPYILPARTGEFAAIFALLGLLVMSGLGLFSRRQRAGVTGLALRTLGGALIAGLVAYLLSRMTEFGALGGRTIFLATVVGALLAAAVLAIVGKLINEDVFRRRVVVYGSGVRAKNISLLRRRADQRGFRLLGFVQLADEPVEVGQDRVLPIEGSLMDYVRKHEVDEIVIAMDDRRRNFPVADLLECRLAGINITDIVTFLERETGKVHLDVLNPSWLIFADGFRRDVIRRYEERVFDVISSSALLIITAPIMLLTMLAIKLEDGFRAPIFYKQKRVGYSGKVFDVIKFRSMRTDAEKNGAVWAKSKDTRVTRVGDFIRKVRIDELPQILNVFKGDMAFVGPRPERPEFVSQLAETIPYYHERHWVKPGITGWAQLCYPYGASERDAVEKLQFDLYYVKNHSLLFDLMILVQTAEVILLRKGAR
ncbi:MAG TPA: TIGR03013 family XrtA/PEP-CTERM system glycosyltransferase [Steroidobacteraceae bacterium]|nr:TIGR03013 family XrtA/PEP-CTERM system glycosyltransferase [Steroidobacteraceae bacterium]